MTNPKKPRTWIMWVLMKNGKIMGDTTLWFYDSEEFAKSVCEIHNQGHYKNLEEVKKVRVEEI